MKDEIIDLEDDSDKKTNLVATSAIVFMVHGVTENWKQPIAYYFSNELYDSGKVKKQPIEVVDKMESIGQLFPTWGLISEDSAVS
jgi:hypothetical protein